MGSLRTLTRRRQRQAAKRRRLERETGLRVIANADIVRVMREIVTPRMIDDIFTRDAPLFAYLRSKRP